MNVENVEEDSSDSKHIEESIENSQVSKVSFQSIDVDLKEATMPITVMVTDEVDSETLSVLSIVQADMNSPSYSAQIVKKKTKIIYNKFKLNILHI